MDNNDLLDLGYTGNSFTWENRRDDDILIQERLDRAIGNYEWLQLFPDSIVTHEPKIGSDHSPLLISLAPHETTRAPRIFRFNAAWAKEEGCESNFEHCLEG